MKKSLMFIPFILCIWGIMFAQTMEVTSPEADVSWQQGRSYTITWKTTGPQYNRVKIRLFDQTGKNKIMNIVENAPNSGNFGPWKVPQGVTPGRYVIRVKTRDNLVTDDSDVFNITESTKVELTLANDPNKKVTKKTPDIRKPNIGDKIMPRITSISPAGSSPGSPVWLRGRNFGKSQGSKELFLKGVSNINQYLMDIVWWYEDSIQAKLKNGVMPGNYKLSIRSKTGKMLSNEVSLKVNALRSVTLIRPDRGPKETRFILQGPDFGVKPASNLHFKMIKEDKFGIPFTLISWGKNMIVGKVSSDYASQGLWEVVVQHPNHVDYTTRVNFRVIPFITHTIPDKGPFKAGTKILIYGKSFMKKQEDQKVVLMGNGQSEVLYVTLWSDEVIAARFNKTLPAGNYRVKIVNRGLSYSDGVLLVITK